jgi:hypothetical protein
MLSKSCDDAWSLSDFPSHKLRSLDTRRPLLPDFIRRILKRQLGGKPARYTDAYLAAQLDCCNKTIANLRAWCKENLSLKVAYRGWRGHVYEFDLKALAHALANAVAAARDRVDAFLKRFNEGHLTVGEEALRSSHSKASSDQGGKIYYPNLEKFATNSEHKSDEILKKNTETAGCADLAPDPDPPSSLKGPDGFASELDPTLAEVSASLQGSEALTSTTTPTADLSAAAPPHTATWRQWVTIAKDLIASRGQRWNPNLQRLCEGLDGESLKRAVLALWEQSLKGRVRNAPAWLTTAIQRRFAPSKSFVPPSGRPQLKHREPEAWQTAADLMQPQYAQSSWYQAYVRQYGEDPRIEDTVDGPALLHNGRLTPVSWLATGG